MSLNRKRFRRIEYKSEIFYLRLQEKDQSNELQRIEPPENFGIRTGERRDCLKTDLPLVDSRELIVGEVKVTSVTSIYLEGLHNQCESFDPRKESDGLG